MPVIRAKFDGKSFVPDEPPQLRPDQTVRLLILSDDGDEHPLRALAELSDTFPDDPDWPLDGARETDHYLYGTPKRES